MPLRVGLIGCGRISGIYLQNCAMFEAVDVVAYASLDIEESRAKAAQHLIARAGTPDGFLADPDSGTPLIETDGEESLAPGMTRLPVYDAHGNHLCINSKP